MYAIECDREKRVFVVNAAGAVRAEEVAAGRDELMTLLQAAEPGFAVLADFRRLESMTPETCYEIGKVMDLFAAKEVALVVRVISDRFKDAGLNILSHFHYRSEVQVSTVATLAEAIVVLNDAS